MAPSLLVHMGAGGAGAGQGRDREAERERERQRQTDRQSDRVAAGEPQLQTPRLKADLSNTLARLHKDSKSKVK